MDPERSPRDRRRRGPVGDGPHRDLEPLAQRIAAGQAGWPGPDQLDDALREQLAMLVRREHRQRLIRLIARLIARDILACRGRDSTDGAAQ